ncbi:cation diffusion facilitator family transporter [Sphingomonas sp. LaA6.9]|uniref:cation diffusion facilitator family transporter n=1 Tax=Sphingomonas sp. LaA6.9 TaxID=2919914 RepID=UPI001F4F33F1|nr:cation diffusion facilitator family transporter [Sphingomonas sp. LaA6.9]MCJ8156260.1 cation diffusion facilitator family transporter [Sphingomonas sp. LaA6.9]
MTRATLTQRAAIASVCTAVFLLALKSWAAWITGSVAMLGSLADTALDLVASLVTLFSVRYAAQPADRAHRFGHGKAEALAALFQVVLISISACGIAVQAVRRLIAGDVTANAEYGIGVSIAALVATLALIAYQRHVIRQTRSIAISADNVHYQSDLLLNGSVIAALILDQFLGVTGADPVFGVLIALWLLYGALRASTSAINQLMDREWPEEKRQRFLAIVAQHHELHGVHDLRTRSSGALDFVQFHVWVRPDMTVAEAHEISEAAERDLMAAFPDTEILIHLDPDGQIDRLGEPDEALRETPE